MSEFERLLESVKDKIKTREDRFGYFRLLVQTDDSRLISTLNDIVSDKKETPRIRVKAVEYLYTKGDATSLPILSAFDKEITGVPLPLAIEARKEIAFTMSAIYQREFPPAQAAGMKAAATAYATNRLGPAFPRADVVMPGESAQIS